MNEFSRGGVEALPQPQRISFDVRRDTSGQPPLRLELEVPAGVDVDIAHAEWFNCGGQVRQFGAEVVDQTTLPFPDWLVAEKGAIVILKEPEAA